MDLLLIVVVILFAVVQSVFGVGLLVFGTPTLLLLGFSFEETLAYLLPSSIVISALQLRSYGGLQLDSMRRHFLVYTAPLVLAGTVLILTVGAGVDIRLIVGAMLILSGVIRMLGPAKEMVSRWARRHLRGFLALLGVIHGLSNLGGGVMTVIVGAVYDAKDDIRRQIAFAYGLMASVQLATLVFAAENLVVAVLPLLLLPMLAGATYISIGNRAFRATSQAGYQVSLTALIIVFGLVLVVNFP